MDKTNVTIKLPGRILSEKENLIDLDEQELVQRLIRLLQSRKNLVNVSFQSKGNARQKSTSAITKIEILLADEGGDFNYYED
ncbi:hypothetical protein [Flavobacterium caeni]|uniref:Uncharacterized protein n=1 Tax=Flavobacterium caeni TaxID=490189 RepID=A0A1G5BIU0_9FLAO|nr:hypothetical protein [Flavobacterium caeni]SCX90044.1 hypothetical protein SAMN02927903_00389 [Flavobacterium caeni]